ncbi:MAG: VanZ family protein [Balneolales bacterium]
MISLLNRYPNLYKIIPGLLILWTLLTFYLTLSPSDYLASAGLFQYDKIGHFAMCGGWTGLIGLYLMVYKQNHTINLLPLIIIGLSFGAFIELLQLTLPINREPSFMDMVANSLGSLTAWGVLRHIQNRLIQNKKDAWQHY